MENLFLQTKQMYNSTVVDCPDDWGGFYITPKRIEFMEFQMSRLHKRTLFYLENEKWNHQLLQP